MKHQIQTQVRLLGKIAVNSANSRHFSFVFRTDHSSLDAHGGLISGTLALKQFTVNVAHRFGQGDLTVIQISFDTEKRAVCRRKTT
jgi:hypothetical protein